MALSKDVPPKHVLHQYLLDDSKKFTEDIEVEAQKAVESIDKLNLHDELELTALLSESNVFVTNISNIVSQIRIILLHVNMEPSTKQALSTIAQKLSEIAHSVSNSYSDEPAKLQLALKTNVQSVSVEAKNLFNLLETGALKEREQEYLDILRTLLMDIDIITVRNQIIHLNPEEISKLITNMLEKMWESIDKLTSENEYLLSALTYYMNIGCRIERKVVPHLLQHGQYYDEGISKDFLHTSLEMHNLLNRMQEVYDNPYSLNYCIATTSSNVRSGCQIMSDLAIHLNKSDSKDIRSIREAIHHMISLTLSNGDELARAFKICAKFN